MCLRCRAAGATIRLRGHTDGDPPPECRVEGRKLMIVALSIPLATATLAGQVVAPRVATDRSVDCHSLESIVADVCRPTMSDQEKAVALFGFVRRMMFHYPQRSERLDPKDDLDTLRLLNTYGYSLCSQQALVLVDLWRAAGIESLCWGVPGHCTAQAEYDGGCHWFDPLIGAYVYRRDGKTIASLQDIAADPSLLTQAVEEDRASPAFVPCRTVLRDDAARFARDKPEYVKECADLADDVTFMARRAHGAKRAWGPNPQRYEPDLALRRGEAVTFLWSHLPGEVNCKTTPPGAPYREQVLPEAELPPHHFCGVAAERRDAANFPYWRPYVKTVKGVRTGRYYANGTHVYGPSFAREPSKGDFVENTFAWAREEKGLPALRVRRAGTPAALVCRMRTPHVYTSATVSAELARARRDDASRIWVSCDGQKTWRKVYDAGRAAAGRLAATVDLRDEVVGMRDLWFRFECRTAGNTAKAGLHGVKIEAVFQHNMFARPCLGAGANRVSVRVGNPDVLEDCAFTVRYAWKEGRRKATHAERIARSPHAYTIDVAGERMPRMVSLELAVAR